MFTKVTQFLSRIKAPSRKATRREAFRASLRYEQLEDRRLMTVTHTFNNGILTITSDSASDVINVQQSSMNVFYQANGSGNLGLTSVGSVTRVVVNAGGGNDTVTAPTVTKPLTIIGGLGDDTLSGGPGNDVIYGDDVPTQTFSAADPFTTSQSGGTTYTNLPSGSFFNQRRVARFNNATSVSVASATQDWKATLPIANSSRTNLMYRQDFNLTPKDLTGLGSMSFDITVTGSVNGYWNLLDSNGYIAEVPAGFTLPAGNHTVTLDLSTAAIDEGFDLSKIVSMDISIAAASANSTIVVKNFRKGEFLPAAGGNDIINGLGGADQLFGQAGDDTFRISGVREAFGELINGGSGLDTVRNVTTNDIVLTDFRTTGGHGRQTVFQVEQFFGNNKGILGRDSSAGADGVGNDTDDLDFTGIEFSGVTTINLRSGNDQYIGGKTALTVNGGTGNDTMSAGVGGGTLSGEAGNDTLTGGTAATTLSGGAGVDILNAGVGATTFNFVIADTNNAEDQVFGFRKGTDKIRLNTSHYGQGQLAVVAGSSPSGTGASSQIRYNNNGVSGDTTIYLPGTGGLAFRRIKLVGFFGALDSTDFIQV